MASSIPVSNSSRSWHEREFFNVSLVTRHNEVKTETCPRPNLEENIPSISFFPFSCWASSLPPSWPVGSMWAWSVCVS